MLGLNKLKLIGLLILGAAVASQHGAARSTEVRDELDDDCSVRLPTNVVPKHYDLSLEFAKSNLDQFSGRVKIHLEFGGDTGGSRGRSIRSRLFRPLTQCFRGLAPGDSSESRLVLHASKHVTLGHLRFATLDSMGQVVRKIPITKVERDLVGERVYLTLASRPERGARALLSLEFKSLFRNDLRGVYRNFYPIKGEPEGGLKARYIASAFQPTDARSAFPCFDEPNLKATFRLRVIHKERELALSNAPALSREDSDTEYAMVVTEFKPTPPMSVHMFGFVVGEFDYVERRQVGVSRVPVRVYTPTHLAASGEFALEMACRAMDYMERYTEIAYPMEKLDLVALYDHDKDNTESWAMAVIRANVSLFDEETRDDFKITIGVNVAHVVAHQWFGNLITADWWDNLWITESVAAQKAFEILLAEYPQFQSEYFVRLATLSGVLQADSHVVNGLHPLVPDVGDLQSSAQIYSIFDVLQFMKSGSLCQLMQNELGPETFRKSLKLLLNRHSFSSVSMQDYSAAIEAESGEREFLANFQTQLYNSSYPVISVQADVARESIQMEISNELAPRKLGLSVQFGDATEPSRRTNLLLPTGSLATPSWYESNNENHWFKLNPKPDISTYFRVMYSDSLLESNFKQAIGRKLLEPLDRLNVLDDAVGLVMSNEMEPSSFKRLLDLYAEEDNGAVILEMLIASKVLSALKLPAGAQTASPVGQVMLKVFERFGFDEPPSGSFLDRRAQMSVLNALVKAGNQKAIEAALNKFDLFDGVVHRLHLREPIYAAVVGHGAWNQVEKLLQHLERTQSLEEQTRLFGALSSSSDGRVHEALRGWLDKSRVPEDTRKQWSATLDRLKTN